MKITKLSKSMSLIKDIDTPAIIVDLNIVKENIATYQRYCDDVGLSLIHI